VTLALGTFHFLSFGPAKGQASFSMDDLAVVNEIAGYIAGASYSDEGLLRLLKRHAKWIRQHLYDASWLLRPEKNLVETPVHQYLMRMLKPS